MKILKRSISVLTSFLLTGSFVAANSSFAEGTDNPNLLQLAFELGADTDYLNIANYPHTSWDEVSDKSIRWFINNGYNSEICNASNMIFSNVAGGMCYGISVVEVLSHNGVISPSDIVEGAETLSDIEYCDDADSIITAYQCMQSYLEPEYYTHEFVSKHTYAEQIDALLEMAERNMADNKYFLITFSSEKAGHAVAGIGVAEGTWEFEGNVYDKCILTLDSNSKTEDGTVLPYVEKSNIYIDSEAKQVYIPAYANSENFGEITAVCGFDDEAILNYRGILNPTESLNEDYSDIASLELSYIGYVTEYDTVIRDRFGNEYTIEEPVNKFISGLMRNTIYTHGAEFIFTAIPTATWTKPRGRVALKNKDYGAQLYCIGDSVQFKISGGNMSIEPTNNKESYCELSADLNDRQYYQSSYCSWLFMGNIKDKISFEFTQNGVILRSDDAFEGSLSVYSTIKDNSGQTQPDFRGVDSIGSYFSSSVLATVSDAEELILYIDPDKDGIYDAEVEKGDVNCDGLKDAVDASLVLYTNAQLVDDWEVYLDNTYADVNGDGLIDAVDASLILAMNAELTGETA